MYLQGFPRPGPGPESVPGECLLNTAVPNSLTERLLFCQVLFSYLEMKQ